MRVLAAAAAVVDDSFGCVRWQHSECSVYHDKYSAVHKNQPAEAEGS